MTRRIFLTILLLVSAVRGSDRAQAATGVESVGVTVSDLDRAVDFYTRVLSFRKISETEVDGEAWERLYGVFGLRIPRPRISMDISLGTLCCKNVLKEEYSVKHEEE